MSAHCSEFRGHVQTNIQANLSNDTFVSHGFILDCLVVRVVGIGQRAAKFNSSVRGFRGRISLLSRNIFLRLDFLHPNSSVVVCELSINLG